MCSTHNDKDKTDGQNTEDREYEKRDKISSQFCWNGMLVSKEHLVRTMRTAYVQKKNGNNNNDENNVFNVPFLPITYDLSHIEELKKFIIDFSERENLIKINDQNNTEEKKEKKIDNCSDSNCNSYSNIDNIWILKRYRGRQSMDYPITNNLSCALRHLESAPRLACKYVSSPSLWKGRKYDLRYYVIVLSLDPLILYRHKMFVVRAANILYSSDDFEMYQKHFTVMNFIDDSSCLENDSVRAIRGSGARENPTSIQFIENFNIENFDGRISDDDNDSNNSSNNNNYNNNNNNNNNNNDNNNSNNDNNNDNDNDSNIIINTDSDSTNPISKLTTTFKNIKIKKNQDQNSRQELRPWESTVQPAIDVVLRQIFQGVSDAFENEPSHPSGQKLYKNSGWSLNQPNVCFARAMYGIDIIIGEDNKPFVLEVQWAPDCAQAVVQNPFFWNDILGGLYLDDMEKFNKL